jgi:hypothetical protein
MGNTQPEYELIRIWLMANEGFASEDDLKQLNTWLESDPDARKSLFHLTRQQSWLVWNGASAPGMARAAIADYEGLTEAVGVESPAGRSGQEDSRPHRASAGRAGGLIARSRAAFSGLHTTRIPLLSYRMAALAACIAVVAGWFALDYKRMWSADRLRLAEDVRAEMIDATVCIWSGGSDGTPALGHQFHEGDALQLLEGVAELRIASMTTGAELQLEGPVAVVIGANGLSNLRYGKVAIQTSHTGAGFQVATSFGRVIAGPGAEIGISTFGNSAEVHVFDGIVALESPWITSDDGELAVRHIRAGEAVRLSQLGEASLQMSNIAPDRGLFTTRLSMDANFLKVQPNYVQAIHDSNPVCYWRFESTDGNRVRNEMGDRFQGELRGDYRSIGPTGNQALEFGVAPNPGSMRVSDSWDDVLANNFSFEFWMRPSHYHVGTILGLAGPFDPIVKRNSYGIAVEIRGGWGNGATTNRVRFLNRVPLAMSTPGMSVYSGQRYQTRRWQHVVAVRDDNSMKLYLDGNLVQTGRALEKIPEGLQLIVGQLYTEALERPFIGYLDEMAIYDRALNEQEVQEHYRLIRSEAKPRDSI